MLTFLTIIKQWIRILLLPFDCECVRGPVCLLCTITVKCECNNELSSSVCHHCLFTAAVLNHDHSDQFSNAISVSRLRLSHMLYQAILVNLILKTFFLHRYRIAKVKDIKLLTMIQLSNQES